MNCHNYRDHLGILYTVAGNFLPIKHGMWHGVDEIVDACMNISVLLALWDTFATEIFYCQTFTRKSTR